MGWDVAGLDRRGGGCDFDSAEPGPTARRKSLLNREKELELVAVRDFQDMLTVAAGLAVFLPLAKEIMFSLTCPTETASLPGATCTKGCLT